MSGSVSVWSIQLMVYHFQVLAHRLGLIPLKVDPRKFDMLPPCTYHYQSSVPL